MPEVARFYGLQINRSGMALCPFHEEKTPSLKIYEDNFHCFGCGESGDCTGFVAKLFGISQKEAAKKISYDFGLRLFDDRRSPSLSMRSCGRQTIIIGGSEMLTSLFLNILTS